jgi:hypothetical protein
MNVWKLAAPIVACVASLYASGCAVQEEVDVAPRTAPPPPVQVQQAPPPDYDEAVPVAPRANYIWVRGNWHWNGYRYVWLPGRYSAVRPGVRWVPARYEGRGGVYYFVPGHWARY